MSDADRYIYQRIARNVSRITGLLLNDQDVRRLLDLGKGTGSPDADELIRSEAREYGLSS